MKLFIEDNKGKIVNAIIIAIWIVIVVSILYYNVDVISPDEDYRNQQQKKLEGISKDFTFIKVNGRDCIIYNSSKLFEVGGSITCDWNEKY